MKIASFMKDIVRLSVKYTQACLIIVVMSRVFISFIIKVTLYK